MTTISATATAAREQSRQSDGKFGIQQLGTQDGALPVPFSQRSRSEQYAHLVRTLAQHNPQFVADTYQVPAEELPDVLEERIKGDWNAGEEEDTHFQPQWDDFQDQLTRDDPYVQIEAASDDVDYDQDASTSGDYSVAGEASFRRTWATGDPDMPYVTATVTHYAEAYANVGECSGRQLSDVDHDEYLKAHRQADHAEARAAKLRDAAEGLDEVTGAGYRLDALRFQTEADVLREEFPGDLQYAVSVRTEWVGHTDREDAGGSQVANDIDTQDVDSMWISSIEEARRDVERGAQIAERTADRDLCPQNAFGGNR